MTLHEFLFPVPSHCFPGDQGVLQGEAWNTKPRSPTNCSQHRQGPAAGGPRHRDHGGSAAVQQPPVTVAGGRAESSGLLWGQSCDQREHQDEEEWVVESGQNHGVAIMVAGQPGCRTQVCAGLGCV